MKINNFEMFALLLASCLFGTIISTYYNANLVTDREMGLVLAFYVATLLTFFTRKSDKKAIISYLSRHNTEVEMKQNTDLQEAHRRHTNQLKREHGAELHRLHNALNFINGKFDRVHADYDWVLGQFQEQLRVNQEQEDRIKYLEDLRKQSGLSSPARLAPFSAPASQIEFADPTLRARRPLPQVAEGVESEE
ncbi:hypothetical protein EK21DRAFT_112579 [Setomelanomma holmii]|uniref:Uncharacterized protein n=1 Tax=Setomelanomma holmii TaxID=210430 RepID=A0A9P4H9K7_9PLEO|nr:hypothetical protein EK21DRAFT_112579 [Setomelanomma holmii]